MVCSVTTTTGLEIYNFDVSPVDARVVLSLRMVSRDGIGQDGFVAIAIEICGIGPPEVMHLVDEGALVQDGTNKVDRGGHVVRISTHHPFDST